VYRLVQKHAIVYRLVVLLRALFLVEAPALLHEAGNLVMFTMFKKRCRHELIAGESSS
jgi:hypothetical protein